MFYQICILMLIITSGQSRPSDKEIVSLVDEEIPHLFRDYLIGTKQWFIYIQQLASQVKDVASTLDASIERICQRVSLALIWGKQPKIVQEVVSITMGDASSS